MGSNDRGFIVQLEVVCVPEEEPILSPLTLTDVLYPHTLCDRGSVDFLVFVELDGRG